MATPTTHDPGAPAVHGSDAALEKAIEHAAHLLPAQGPISVFIHHNTLHAFESLPFCEAVVKGSEVFGFQPFLSEARYQDELERGRIRFDELREVLCEEAGDITTEIHGMARRIDLRLAMLRYRFFEGTPPEISWYLEEGGLRKLRAGVPPEIRGRLISETRHWVLRDLRTAKGWRGPQWLPDLLRRFGESSIEDWPPSVWEAFSLRALWETCMEKAGELPPAAPAPHPIRHRDALIACGGPDTDVLVHEPLIRFCEAYLDQGVADWPMQGRETGFFRCFAAHFGKGGPLPRPWLAGLSAELERLEKAATLPLGVIRESLSDLGVGPTEVDAYLSATLLALRGWAGIIRQVERTTGRVPLPVPAGTLVEYLAVRLLMERFALRVAAREVFGYHVPLSDLRAEARTLSPREPGISREQRAFHVFQLAQVLAWTPEALCRLSPTGWEALMGEIEAFGGVERRRVFHLAYERRFQTMALDALAIRAADPDPTPASPRLQVVLCIDEREESFRRHLEEAAPDCETFGAAGFYGVAMYYRGAEDAYYIPKCPIILTPGHWIEEVLVDGKDESQLLASRRKALGHASHGLERSSRSFALGAIVSGALGALATIPLVARALFPRLASRVERVFERFVRPAAPTRLTLERSLPTPGENDGGRGYSSEEMANIAERQLRDIGLLERFARLVLILGHGSNSQNNPHKSAYDCGACGGSAGGANGRALASMLNDPRTREALATRGIRVPRETWFVGGFHNTCDDTVTLLDTDLVPVAHAEDLHTARRIIGEACARNAQERSRRFWSAPLNLGLAEAHWHVEERSEDLAQTRPELGHATNALCIVARRGRTRGLFLDRRAFLVSYDPTRDDNEGRVLTRLLSAAVPVCGGINLEYYFSHVDSPGWGCGTKLPHNVTSLLGVMDGAASDMRTGLPWQMVEIHEPVRLQFLVETTPETILGIMDRNEGIGALVRNEWVLMAVLDPHSAAIQVYRNGTFRPYSPRSATLPWAESSIDWYRGWRDHLDFARIGGPPR